MACNPYHDHKALAVLESRLSKVPGASRAEIKASVAGHIDFARSYPSDLPHGGRVLDFGCGIGDSVYALLGMGFDAWGVDVFELWNRDSELMWVHGEGPSREVMARLRKVDLRNYRLPFPDEHFDFCFSDQVMEHVFNLRDVMSEIGRVLKPGAISVHRFPGPTTPFEGHISVPIVPLCRLKWYLTFWAMMGVRSPRQHGLGWRETRDLNVELLRFCNYPTARKLYQIAREAGVAVEFHNEEGIKRQNLGRAVKLFRIADSMGLGNLALRVLSLVSQRYMVVKRPTT